MLAEARKRGVVTHKIADFRNEPGRGLVGRLRGEELRVGNPAFVESLIPDEALREELRAAAAERESAGETAVAAAWAGGRRLGLLLFRDTLREGAAELVGRLRKLGITRTVMLTGDAKLVAEAVSRQVGIDECRAPCLPEDKVAAVRELVERHGAVVMVGDGLNDAPALAAATAGVAMGGIASDAALEAADVVLMGSDIRKLPPLVRLAQSARRIMLQNLAFATAAMVVLVVFTILGYVPLPVGVMGHEGGTLLVVGNGLRLLFFRSGP